MQLKPLHDLVLVKPVKAEKQGDIFLPAAARFNANTGIVEEVSDGARGERGEFCPLMVHKGDAIMYTGDGIPVKVGTEELILLRESEIFAIISKDALGTYMI